MQKNNHSFKTLNQDKSLLLSFLGEKPSFKIIDFLIDNKGIDFSKLEIAKGSNVSKATLFKYWKFIEKHNLVKITRRYGKTKLYTLNNESQIIKDILNLEKTIINEFLEKEKNSKSEIITSKTEVITSKTEVI